MVKKYIIDGYNVLNKMGAFARARRENFGAARDKFVEVLGAFADYEGVDILLVFDGTPHNPNIKRPGDRVEIRFPARGHTADSAIERLVYEEKNKDEVTVVTDDYCERSMVSGMGCCCMSSADFEDLLHNALTEKSRDTQKHNIINSHLFKGTKLDI